MTGKVKHIFLMGICLAIITVILMFPSGEWMNYLIMLLVGIVAYYLHIAHWSYFKNRSKTEGSFFNDLLRKVAFGAGLSILSMGLILGIISIMGGYTVGESYVPFDRILDQTSPLPVQTDYHLIKTIVLYMSSALAEETAFRMFGIGILMIPLTFLVLRSSHGSKDRIAMRVGLILNILIAFLFGLIHKDSPGFSILSLINITISGFIYGYLFLIQKDIISAWSMHLSWNLCQLFVGLPVSGKYLPSASLAGDLFQGARDNIISGGSYGPEGSVVTVFVQISVVIFLVICTRR